MENYGICTARTSLLLSTSATQSPLSGTIPQKSKDNPDDTSPQNHLIVTKLDMVSDTCKQ
jgi:hypothetical protein